MSQQINLFSPTFLKRGKYFSARAMLMALGLIAVGAVLLYAYARYQTTLLARQYDAMVQHAAADQQRLTRLTRELSTHDTSQSLQEELKKLQFAVASQRAVLDVLQSGSAANTTGYSVYMRAFARQSMEGVWLTGFDIEGDGAVMTLNGATLMPQLVPAYIQRLGNEPSMRGKSFSTLLIQQPNVARRNIASSYLEFSIQSAAGQGGGK